jgi:hypothetical protein
MVDFWVVVACTKLPTDCFKVSMLVAIILLLNLTTLVSDFYSVMSEGSATDSVVDNESQDGADAETDDEDGTYFDTNETLYSDALRSASYRSREGTGNASIYDRDSSLHDGLHGFEMAIKDISYPYVKRRDNLPEPKEKDKPVGLWSIIKDNIGKDLSGVCLPVYFNEPLSSLQKCFEDLEYSNLVDRALEWGKQVRSSAVLSFVTKQF